MDVALIAVKKEQYDLKYLLKMFAIIIIGSFLLTFVCADNIPRIFHGEVLQVYVLGTLIGIAIASVQE